MQIRPATAHLGSRRWLHLLLISLFAGYHAAAQSPIGTRHDTTSAETRQSETPSPRKQVRGTVHDETGEPLPGVTVRHIDGTGGTITDIDGAFSLPAGSEKSIRLLFSYVGKKEVELTATPGKPIDMVLTDDVQMISDVVVTGYQTLSRERVTGAFDKVGNEALANRPSTDISTALQGLVAGMQGTEKEDGTVDFLIRGSSSLHANTAPLVVVDGFPIEGSFSSINPNDVESITILKDASAASIWGARSANGVIVVTTKRAKNRANST